MPPERRTERGRRAEPAGTPREPEREERWRELARLEELLEGPMALLGLVWLLLLVVELVSGGNALFSVLGTIIWAVFLVDFLVRLVLAPDRRDYLRGNILTALSLALPALRIFRAASALRVLRVGRAARGLQLVRVVASFRRAMSSLGAAMNRRGLGYVVALTALVTLLGAAGVYGFESTAEGTGGFASYWEALWWTLMLLTTLGSEYWPRSAEARLLTFLLAVYGLAVFGYITASLASFFIGSDAERRSDEGVRSELATLRSEIAELRAVTSSAGPGGEDDTEPR